MNFCTSNIRISIYSCSWSILIIFTAFGKNFFVHYFLSSFLPLCNTIYGLMSSDVVSYDSKLDPMPFNFSCLSNTCDYLTPHRGLMRLTPHTRAFTTSSASNTHLPNPPWSPSLTHHPLNYQNILIDSSACTCSLIIPKFMLRGRSILHIRVNEPEIKSRKVLFDLVRALNICIISPLLHFPRLSVFFKRYFTYEVYFDSVWHKKGAVRSSVVC